jgi:hypothetical protein
MGMRETGVRAGGVHPLGFRFRQAGVQFRMMPMSTGTGPFRADQPRRRSPLKFHPSEIETAASETLAG